MQPGSHRDLRRSAMLARYLALFDALSSGVLYLLFPDTVTTGNVAFVERLMPLQVWGTIWIAASLATFLRRRETGQALLALTYALWAIGTGATYLTGEIDNPGGPIRALAMAGLFWWFRARAVARSAGTLIADDLELRDDDRPGYRRPTS